MRFAPPSVDLENPFYCPDLPPASYIKSLQSQVRRESKTKTQSRNHRLLVSFAKVLENALLQDPFDSSDEKTCFPIVRGDSVTRSMSSVSRSSSSSDEINPFSNRIPLWEREHRENFWRLKSISSKKRKRGSFSDIRGPTKYAKSILSAHDSSFDVIVKRETLDYSTIPGSPVRTDSTVRPVVHDDASMLTLRLRDLQGTLCNLVSVNRKEHKLLERYFGPSIGTESARDILAFINVLDDLLPGIRLKERILRLSDISHQSIIDLLGVNGYLSSRILSMFRSSEIQWVTLTESLENVGGLNICGDLLPSRTPNNLCFHQLTRIYTAFNQPNSFLFVKELSLRDTPIHDFDLVHIHHLPRLATLLLDNTTISNEAIFLLVPLKRTLTQLSISSNPAISDDAAPAIQLLSKLTFLSILDTGFLMPGLRRIAQTIADENRIIDVEIPSTCTEYIRELDSKYEIDPRPPLITVPEVCAQLSAAALQRNLIAHKQKNSAILATGSKAEMAKRLKSILEVRRMDMLVHDMVFGTQDRTRE